MRLTESDIEAANLDWLSGLGWTVAHGPDMAPEGKAPERASYGDVLLLGRLKDALARINPQLPPDTLDDIVRKIVAAEMPSLIEENRRLHNPTLVVLTDRNDLDDQLFGTFSLCRDLIRQTPAQADNRDELRKLLSVASGGVIFTTIQKFLPADGEETFPLLTDRKNVIVIAD